MSQVKKVEKDQVTFSDGTILKDRKGRDLLELYHSAVFDLLTTGKADTKNPLSAFVKAGIKKLESNSLQTIERLVEHTADYYVDDNVDEEFIEYRLSKKLFPWQKEVLSSDSDQITLQCGRRSGKSFAEAYIAVNHCTKGSDLINGFEKGRKVAIIGLTESDCAEVFWQNLKEAADLSGMHYKANNSSHQITFANGSTIQLFGNGTKDEREKTRGKEFSLIIIDEAQSQKGLHYLLVDILGAIITLRRSKVILSGTGSLTGFGEWVDLCENPSWRHFRYTMEDNPIAGPGALEKERIKQGWSEDNITYQREYLANHVIDTTRMIIPKWHEIDSLPEDFIATECYVGLDYGWTDYTALVAIVFDKNGKAYVVDTEKFKNKDTDHIVERCKVMVDSLSEKFKVNPLVIADNSHQMISATISRRGVRIANAIKHDATTGLKQQIFDTSNALGNGTIEILKNNDDLIYDFKNTVWKWDNEKKAVIYEEDKEYYHPDLFHALRYAYCTHKAKYRN